MAKFKFRTSNESRNPKLEGDRETEGETEALAFGIGASELGSGSSRALITAVVSALVHPGAGGFEDLAFAFGKTVDAVGGDFFENRVHFLGDEVAGRQVVGP